MNLNVKCLNCGAVNRVAERPGKVAVCGRCGSELAGSKPIVLSDANFMAIVENANLPVIVDFWAAWCGPCRMVAPVIDALAAELAGKAIVAKVDVDANPGTASRFGVQSIPTIIIFKDGREASRLIGVQSREAILSRSGISL